MTTVRNVESQLYRAVAGLSQRALAEQLGISESRMSALMKDDELINRLAKIVVACGFRLVPITEPTYPAGHVDAMETLARLYMEQLRVARMGDGHAAA